MHCQVVLFIKFRQRWLGETHASRAKTNLALLADSHSTLVIKETILLAIIALIFDGWQCVSIGELRHVSLGALGQLRIDYLIAEIGDSCWITIT